MRKAIRDLSTDLSKQDILAYIRDHAGGVGKRELIGEGRVDVERENRDVIKRKCII